MISLLLEAMCPEELKNKLETENFVEDELILIVPKSHPFALKTEKKLIKMIYII